MNRRSFILVASCLAGVLQRANAQQQQKPFTIAPGTRQLIVGLADNWGSTTVTLQRYVRSKAGAPWQPAGAAWQGRLGAAGLVWGRGVSPVPAGGTMKREGDRKAPAGAFLLGGACGIPASIPRHPALPYFQVTSRDLWVEDPASPQYNRHIRLDHEPKTEWEKKAQMKQSDPAHALKLFIAHNAPPNAVAGVGSSIFFHIWRANGTKATSGCTTMPEAKLREMIAWIDPGALPVYVLLPRAEYAARQAAWLLP